MELPIVVQPVASAASMPFVLLHLAPAKVSEVYESYWRFAAQRQAVFFRRVRGETPPWTNNPVLAVYKFTNAYRASFLPATCAFADHSFSADEPADLARIGGVVCTLRPETIDAPISR